ncbi:MAG: hypothetical protein IH991_24840 [Planctomycetes bacterium]|nr:hypothetical protein [Planctomycetota bacterium]
MLQTEIIQILLPEKRDYKMTADTCEVLLGVGRTQFYKHLNPLREAGRVKNSPACGYYLPSSLPRSDAENLSVEQED